MAKEWRHFDLLSSFVQRHLLLLLLAAYAAPPGRAALLAGQPPRVTSLSCAEARDHCSRGAVSDLGVRHPDIARGDPAHGVEKGPWPFRKIWPAGRRGATRYTEAQASSTAAAGASA
jgi:hypothetical protein